LDWYRNRYYALMERVQSHRMYKEKEIFVCKACEKMYTIEMIDDHLNKCEKLKLKEKNNDDN